MAYTFEFGNAADEDITIVFNIGSGAANPRIKYDSTANVIEVSHDGTVWETLGYGSGGTSSSTSYSNPARIGDLRMWYDSTNELLRIKSGSDPSSLTDGVALATGGLGGIA